MSSIEVVVFILGVDRILKKAISIKKKKTPWNEAQVRNKKRQATYLSVFNSSRIRRPHPHPKVGMSGMILNGIW